MTFQALLFCPDEKTARVTTQVLTELEFSVETASEPFAAVKKLMGQHFDAIVVDCENEQNASLLFKSARNSSSNQASLAVAVVEGQAGVANAFRIGANLVLTKPINVEQAKSTLRVARGLLRKGGEATKPTTSATSNPAPAAAPATSQASTPADRPSAAPPPASRPSLPTSAVAKPALPAPPSKPLSATAAANTTFDAGKLPSPQKPAIAASLAEADLFEEAAESVPAAPEQPTSQQYPWQPVAKPAGSMAASLERSAAQVDGKKTKADSEPAKAASIAPNSLTKDVRPAFAAAGLARGGAASAPAPARETSKPQLPTTALEAEMAVAPVVAPVKTPLKAPQKSPAKPSVEPVETGFAKTPSPGATPTFAALDSSEAPGGGGSKKGLFVAAAVVVLAVAGYVGYTKLSSGKHAPATAAAEQISSATAASSNTSTATAASVSPSAPASATVVAAPLPAAKSQPPAATTTGSKSVSSEEPEVIVTHAEEAPKLVVKSGLGQKPALKTEPNGDVAAPTLGMNEDQSAISNIVQSTPVAVPKVAAQQQTLKVSQGVTQGLLTKRVQPIYPAQAMQMHIQGAVQMLATISKEGKITSVKVLSGDPILSRAAADAVSQWRYKPYYLNGEPVEIQTQIVVNFKLP
jgi:protein TonB